MPIVLFVALLLLLLPCCAMAADRCEHDKIEPLVHRLAQAWANRALASLDDEKPRLGPVRFMIEHALTDERESRRSNTLHDMDAWLSGFETGGFPVREARPLLRCRKGLCVFDLSAGIAHNHWYLEKVSYKMRGGCAWIGTVYVLDGD